MITDRLLIAFGNASITQSLESIRAREHLRAVAWAHLWRTVHATAARIRDGEGDVLLEISSHDIIKVRLDGVLITHWQQATSGSLINRTFHAFTKAGTVTLTTFLPASSAAVDQHEEDMRSDLETMARLGYASMAAIAGVDAHDIADQADLGIFTMAAESILHDTFSAEDHAGSLEGAFYSRTPLSASYCVFSASGDPYETDLGDTLPMAISLQIADGIGEDLTSCPRMILKPYRISGAVHALDTMEILRAHAAIAAAADPAQLPSALAWAGA